MRVWIVISAVAFFCGAASLQVRDNPREDLHELKATAEGGNEDSSQLMQKVGHVFLGAALASVGYGVKRWIEGRHRAEALERHRQVLDINKDLKEQGLSVDELMNLQAALTGKANARMRHAEELYDQAEPLVREDDTEDLTQLEMNQRAHNNFENATEQLHEVLAQLYKLVDERKSEALRRSQKAWEEFSISHAQTAASSSEGGSIYPVLYLSELTSLTIERTANLQAHLDGVITD